MRRVVNIKSAMLILLIAIIALPLKNKAQQVNDPAIDAKVNALVKQMTLEEKVGQMAQVSIESLGKIRNGNFVFDQDTFKKAVIQYKIGSILNTPGLQNAQQWNNIIQEIQNAAKQTRLKIPVLYGLDDNHGVNYVAGATLFPQEIGQAATWNPELIYNAGVITAYESRAASVPWTYSPVLDLGTNPQWPRIWEDYGEDPYLSSRMGVAFVHGVQDPLGSKDKLVVSLKHYMGYSDPKSGHDRTDAWIPENYLREYHLPAFRACVDANARTVMVNSALINGIPTHINKHVLTDILKDELGFTGFTVSDWQDIENVYRRDHITKDIKGAIMLAINAGIDMSMIPYNYKEFCTDLIALVKEGKVSMSRINDAVTRILRVKEELKLFETPMTYLKDYPKFGSAEFEKASYNTAAESITLLKNSNNVLPLPKTARVLVTGPNANSMRTLNGGWTYTWQGERTDEYAQKYNTILEAVQNKFGPTNVLYERGVSYNTAGKYYEDSIVDMDAAVKAAANVDYILLCIGENNYTETPGNLNDLTLSHNQLLLAKAMIKTGKPVIFILNEGRPRIFNEVESAAAAVIDVYLPSNFGGDALADILTGDVNPSGKLPITYSRFTNALATYIHKPSEGDGNPQGGDFYPQYQFGFGLSYTSFEYSNLSVNKNVFSPGDTATIHVTVKNSGNRDGKEVVELFASDLVASLTPDVKRLRGFEKIDLKAGESKTVTFRLPMKDLAYVNSNNKTELEAGDFKLQVANLNASFSVNKTVIY
ncbi:beta-glucosidase [Ginsengibacter hankyongi]|uniref:beta-glucosidase n=1 Tax=Ginsengibacter hankyongi TaxID=2607284 RepID=A0A5J5IEZ5_9BACT|nr:glycoside hydrolase family 3 N-terminal domain-containing protein [Ginsengibacter hankyongi]KAA9038078.1 beta-glucosidase [Ginsengibacter hankyongi]